MGCHKKCLQGLNKYFDFINSYLQQRFSLFKPFKVLIFQEGECTTKGPERGNKIRDNSNSAVLSMKHN